MKEPPDGGHTPRLKKVLSTAQVWAIAVGLVISGEYFGWNHGWQVAGTIGFLVSTCLVSIFYITFIFSYTELTAAIPSAGGAASYAYRAFGALGGFVAGFATLVNFLLAPPAIAFALGSYVHFLRPELPVLPVAMAAYALFIGINIFGVKNSANFSLWITLLSVIELVVFIAIVFPYFQKENFIAHNPPSLQLRDVLAGVPFAVWFFIAIEGVAMVAEEVKNPQKSIPRGYLSAIFTLVILALGVMILTGGIGDWRQLSGIDNPLPEALATVLGGQHALSKIFASLGVFGLIASFHCNTLSCSRQVYALAREGFLPDFLAELHPKYRTPHWALLLGGAIGFFAILWGTTADIIVMSVLGAMLMYILSLASLFMLRIREPKMHRPFLAPGYPWIPLLSLVLGLVCFGAIVYFNPVHTLIFVGILLVAVLGFLTFGSRYVKEQVVFEERVKE